VERRESDELSPIASLPHVLPGRGFSWPAGHGVEGECHARHSNVIGPPSRSPVPVADILSRVMHTPAPGVVAPHARGSLPSHGPACHRPALCVPIEIKVSDTHVVAHLLPLCSTYLYTGGWAGPQCRALAGARGRSYAVLLCEAGMLLVSHGAVATHCTIRRRGAHTPTATALASSSASSRGRSPSLCMGMYRASLRACTRPCGASENEGPTYTTSATPGGQCASYLPIGARCKLQQPGLNGAGEGPGL
jgi:hypothetical protein